jgi:pyruvate kinase
LSLDTCFWGDVLSQFFSSYGLLLCCRYNNAGRTPISAVEATLMGVARTAVDFSLDRDQDGVIDLSEGCIAMVLSKSGSAARIVAKYRPPCPVVVASTDEQTLRQTRICFGLHPLMVGLLLSLILTCCYVNYVVNMVSGCSGEEP